ncbi:universal stress protein [Levilactobacillus brevis]|uniref:universal stress protein n=1 Tax=Levilactobacillus brevis TaxID=1580 RepID=UPI003518A3EA
MTEKKIFTKILVGVDDSADSQLAFKYAIKRTRLEDAELYIVSVLESDDRSVYEALSKDFIHGERAQLVEHVNEYVQQAHEAGVENVFPVIAEGDPGKEIVNTVIPSIKPEVLIVGSLAKKGPKKYLGSQAAYMAKYAPISVLVVR